MTKVSIVILNWNRADDTIECLRSVSKLKIKDYELAVVIVDNGSTDNSLKTIKKYTFNRKWFEYVVNKKNLGFAGGNNAGMQHALQSGADYVVVLNNDTLVDKNLIVEFLKVV